MVGGSASHKTFNSDNFLELTATLLKSIRKVSSFDDFTLFAGLIRTFGETIMFLFLRGDGEKVALFGDSSGVAFLTTIYMKKPDITTQEIKNFDIDLRVEKGKSTVTQKANLHK